MAILSKLSKYHHTGLLLLRIGLGAMMIAHGYPKLKGGPEMWTGLGESMNNFGIHSGYIYWGFMAAAAEGIGGLLLLIGLWFRPATFTLLCTMIVAATMHTKEEGLMSGSHAIELGVVFLALFIIGPGRFSVDKN